MIKKSPITDGTQEIQLDSWKDFFELADTSFSIAPAYIYRGQANHSWPLRSSLDRHEEQYPKRKNLGGTNPPFFNRPALTEQEHLSAFRRAIRGRRGQYPPKLCDDECWALGQHHGLKTPLLDWTRSPFVALFFAFEEDQVIIDGKLTEPEFRGVFALSTSSIERPPSKPKQLLAVVSPDTDANYRLISQAGLFVKVPRHNHVEAYVKEHFKGETHDLTVAFTKIRIPNEDRTGCLVALNKMNINHMTLFPDIHGAARHVNSLWQPGHEDSIAFV